MDGNEVEGYQLHTVEGTQSVTHDLRVGGKIYARVIKGRNAYLGVFKDGDALAAAYPTPTVGQWAETIEEPNGQGGTGYLYICEIVEDEEVWVRKTAITEGILYPATEERIQELEEKAVTYERQSKASADKAQARANIGAAALNGDATEDFAAKDLTAESATTDELALTNNGAQSYVISGNTSSYVKILNLSNGRHVNLPVVRDDVIALAGDFVEITNAEIDNMDWT